MLSDAFDYHLFFIDFYLLILQLLVFMLISAFNLISAY